MTAPRTQDIAGVPLAGDRRGLAPFPPQGRAARQSIEARGDKRAAVGQPAPCAAWAQDAVTPGPAGRNARHLPVGPNPAAWLTRRRRGLFTGGVWDG